MHAPNHIEFAPLPSAPPRTTTLVAVRNLRPGQLFMRTDSPSEVLVRLSIAGVKYDGDTHAWAIVVAVNHDSEGYVPGQLLKLRRTTLVRLVHEAHPAVYALEQ